jgi:signal transduction histidine kinase/CheY-like chemotaxis protein
MNMTASSADFKSELRVSAGPVAAVLLSASLVGIAVFRIQPPLAALLIGSAATLALDRWRPDAAKAFLAGFLALWLTLGGGWRLAPGALALLFVPVGLAGAMLGLRAAALTAAGAGAALAAMSLLGLPTPPGGELAVALAAVLGMLGLLALIYRPFYQFMRWAEDHYAWAERQLTDTLDDRLRLEQALSDLTHATRQLTLLNERLAALRTVAEEAQKTKAAFVAKVSHEFRTPLNMIIGLVDILMRSQELYGRALPPAVIEDLGIIYRNCEHLAGMIDDVLDLSQAESGQLILHREPTDLNEVIAEAATVVKPLIQKKGLWLEIETEALPTAYCDRTRIRQVILNLLSNAARFTESGGITLRSAAEDGRVTVSVQDTGPGIAPQDMTRIFEPFCQGSQPLWRDRSGSGLGLSISKQFVEMHGGRISLESQLGAGTTFRFDLPVSQPLGPASNYNRWLSEAWVWFERDRRPAARPARQTQPCVLVYDPENALQGALERHAGEVELVRVTTWEEAGADSGQPVSHLALVCAPSGAELRERLRQAARALPDTPIAGCLAAPQDHRLAAPDVLDVLVKPIRRSALLEAAAGAGPQVRRILIADDDAEVVRLWTRMLQAGSRDYEVITAADGIEALAKLRTEKPDLLLLDLLMPGLNGQEVLAQKALDAACRDIPVVLVSAQDPAEEPLRFEDVLLTWNRGLSLGGVLSSALAASAVMLGAAPPPGAPEETARAG